MSNSELQLFQFNTSLVRTITIDGEPWFVAGDVCAILELENSSRALMRRPENMKGVTTGNTLGGTQSMYIVSEAGMYKLVFTSRKPQVEAFTNWVTGEVFPSIRKTGRLWCPSPARGSSSHVS